MQSLLQLWRGEIRGVRWTSISALALTALSLRLWAAREAYPVPADGGHFVQFGMELARGNAVALSTYWSQGMVGIAAAACRLGMDPGTVLQYVSLAAGTLAALAAMCLAVVLMDSWGVGFLVGLWVAVNPVMVRFSITGYSEMPYLACLLSGFAFTWGWVTREGARAWRAIVGFAVLGAAVYFRGLDAFIATALLTAMGLPILIHQRQRRRWVWLVCGVAAFVLIAMPLCVFTYLREGVFAPGSKGAAIVIGDWAYDQKACNPAGLRPWEGRQEFLRQQGLVRYIVHYRGEMSARWVRNATQAFRHVSNALFVGAFRLGPAWVGLMMALSISALLGRRAWYAWACPLSMTMVPLSLVSLVCIFERYTVPWLPFLMMLVAGGISLLIAPLITTAWRRRACVLFLAAFLIKSMLMSSQAFRHEAWWWRYPGARRTGQLLRQYGDDGDVLMTSWPHVAIHFYTNTPLKYVELPYGSLDETERYAERHSVSLIAVSDSFPTKWPVQEVFRGASAPLNWRLLSVISYPGDESRGIGVETYRIYRRE